MLWLALHIPRLPLAAYTVSVKDTDTPSAVVEGRPQSVVAAVNQSAERAGIRVGMTLATALSITPQLRVWPRELAREQQLCRLVAISACQYSAVVSLALPDTVVLEVSTTLKLFRGADHLVKQLATQVRTQGVRIWPAAAPTPRGAWLIAQQGTRLKLSDITELREALSRLPSTSLISGAAHAQALHTLGLYTLGDLLSQPRAGLNQRFGTALLDELDKAFGNVVDPLPLFVPALEFSESLSLPVPIADVSMLQFAVVRLTRTLCRFLHMRGLGVCRLLLCFHHEGAAPTEVVVGVALTRSEAHLSRVVRERLQRLQLRNPAEKVSVQALEMHPLSAAQNSLLPDEGDASSANRSAAEGDVVDQLRARLQDTQVYGLALHADHRPERAYRHVATPSATPSAAITPNRRINTQARSSAKAPRPIWLLDQPRALNQLPQASGYTLISGPERIETGWWDGQPVRRDYFVARSAIGQRCWLFRTAEGNWYLQGLYC